MEKTVEEIKNLLEKKPVRKTKKEQQDSGSKYYLGSVNVRVKKLFPDVILPGYAHTGDSCMDLRAYRVVSITNEFGMEREIKDFEYITLYKGYSIKFGTGIALDLPDGWSADVMVRSGISCNNGIILMNGKAEIDTTYNGELFITLGKLNGKPFKINKNDRIAQFKVVPQFKMEIEEEEVFEEDSANERGADGLGSSGLK